MVCNNYVETVDNKFLKLLDWVNPENFNLDNCSNDSSIGCFLGVDLDYLDELNDLHNNYALVSETLKVTEQILSKYQQKITEDNNFSIAKNKNLIPNLGNKRKYMLHFQNLNIYLDLGLQFKKF